MSTKAQIAANIAAINTGGSNTAVEVRLPFSNLNDEIFQTTFNMTVADAPSVISYNLNFKKVGNIVYIDGYVKNGNTFMIGNQPILTIGNSLYFAKTGQDTTAAVVGTTSLSNGLVLFSADIIGLITNLGAGSKIIINAQYQTND